MKFFMKNSRMITFGIFIGPIFDVDQGDQPLLQIIIVESIEINYRHLLIYICKVAADLDQEREICLQDDHLLDGENRDSLMR